MTNSFYLDPSHVTDEYAQRLQASASTARGEGRSGTSVVRQLVTRLSERVRRQRPFPVATPAELERGDALTPA